MRAIAIQLEPCADKATNIAAARAAIDAALGAERSSSRERRLIVSLPEMWSCLGADRETKLSQSEVLPPFDEPGAPGTAHLFLSSVARTHGIVLHGGSVGERAGDHLYNTTLVFGPDGRERARYRKIHLFDIVTPSGQGYRESSLFHAGDQVVTCETDGLTFGLTICYDLRFPELFLALRRAGADIIFVPSAFTVETGRDHWTILLRARAIETQCYIVAAATYGTHRDASGRPRETYGHSMICDPWGEMLCVAGAGVGHVAADIDIERLHSVREAMPVLAHRRLG